MENNEFYVRKRGDKIILTIVSKTETSVELDIEDAADLTLDIQKYIQQYINTQNAFKTTPLEDAKEQNDKKNNLSAQSDRWMENHFGKLYDLEPIEREVKVNELHKRFGNVYTVDPITFKVTKNK